MARARLHVICGNCGCNDKWTLETERDGDDLTHHIVKFQDAVRLRCGNCGTLHNLKDNVEKVVEKK